MAKGGGQQVPAWAIALVYARKNSDFKSQQRFAAELGVEQSYLSRWERGKIRPGPEYRQKIQELTGLPAEVFDMNETADEFVERIADAVAERLKSDPN